MKPMVEQAVQLAGAVGILLAFAGVQKGLVGQRSRGYLGVNVVGSGTLGAEALDGRQWGFLLLEGTCAVISAVGLATECRGRRPAAGREGYEGGSAPRGRSRSVRWLRCWNKPSN